MGDRDTRGRGKRKSKKRESNKQAAQRGLSPNTNERLCCSRNKLRRSSRRTAATAISCQVGAMRNLGTVVVSIAILSLRNSWIKQARKSASSCR